LLNRVHLRESKASLKDTLRKLAELALTHVATFAFPLAFAVLCGRVLGVHDFGIVSFYTALAAFLGVVIEFGFDWLGIREVSQARDAAQRHQVLYNVTASKLLICLLTSVVACGFLMWLRGPQQAPLMIAMLVHLLGFAMDVSWYLRALERTRLLLGITTVTRIAGIAVLLLAVSRPGAMASALWSYAFVTVTTSLMSWAVLLHQGLAHRAPLHWRTMGSLMRRSSAIVFGNLNAALLTNGGVALLGITADPATVGAANLALRVKMAGQAVLLPIKQLSYVRLSSLAHDRPAEALRAGRIALTALVGGGVLICLGIALAAEAIVRHVFLGDFPVAVGLIMLLGLSVPINAVAELLGMQCLIAFGQERSYAAVVSVAAVVFCVLLLVVLHGSLAYGWALLAAEACLAALAGLQLRSVVARRLEFSRT
jgi:O-antigen/teichoic acid export membrane protein